MSPKVTHRSPSAQPAIVPPPALRSPVNLSAAYRLLEDLTFRQAKIVAGHCGGTADRILDIGYGSVTPSFLRLPFAAREFLRLGLIILPCRDIHGRIVALHDCQFRWLTPPAVHIANPIRAKWTGVRVCRTTSEADSIALEENICAIGVNECDPTMVTSTIAMLKGKESETAAFREWKVAA
jgi:hypothetical protein